MALKFKNNQATVMKNQANLISITNLIVKLKEEFTIGKS